MSQQHQEALATLLYGMSKDGGFVLLTGEVGAGKTTICRCLIEQVPENSDIAYIFNPKLTVVELLSTICDEFRIPYPQGTSSIKQFVDLINDYLLKSHANGRHTVLIIDEAQNLSADVLEQLRLLTNLETNQRKLLQILLIGQPELTDMLARKELRQLAQRIVARFHLRSLRKNEIAGYVKHRLAVSGVQRQLFPNALFGDLYRLSGGVPRIINLLCDRALLGTFIQGKEKVDRSTLAQAAHEVLNNPSPQRQFQRHAIMAGLVLLLCIVAISAYKLNLINIKADVVPYLAVANPAEQTRPVPLAEVVGKAEVLAEALELPPDLQGLPSRDIAFATLFGTWRLAYPVGEDPCLKAEPLGYRCLTFQGGIDDLRQLNIPAVLHMQDNHGHKFYATLTQLEARTGTFSFGTETRRVNFETIALQWSGIYTLLVPLPQEVHDNIQAGESGPGVVWLSKQLAQVQGRTLETTRAAIFDSGLQHQIKQFQLSQGLVPDGAAGQKTLARLSAVADQSAPRLSSGQVKE
jgi:general secretion pathway protein A